MWRCMVAGKLNFDVEAHYPETMQVFNLGAEEPKWELRTADSYGGKIRKGTRVCGRNMVRGNKEQRSNWLGPTLCCLP